MTLKYAFNYFKTLASKTSEKSETKVYQEFIKIISSLEEKNLSETEVQSIEKELDALDLNSPNGSNRKHYNKALTQFKKYLKDTFSLTTKGYYTNIGIALGSSFGVVFGVVLLSTFERSLGIALGISFGMLIGLLIGRHFDSQAKASGKMV